MTAPASPSAGYYDAHNHLQNPSLQADRLPILAALKELPLLGAVVNGTCENDWAEVHALTLASNSLLPSYGLHPWQVGNASKNWRDALQRRLDAEPHAAIGEIGLDRWMLDQARPDDSRLTGLRRASLEEQLEAFSWQLTLAAERNLPVSIHCLDAWGVLAAALRSTPLPARGFLLHAYGGTAEMAREFASLGAYFSFNGFFLGERQESKRTVFQGLPADRILAETDAPAMPLPSSLRHYTLPDHPPGTVTNHPANIVGVYRGLGDLRGWTAGQVRDRVGRNFNRWFGVHLR
jgi:TatD DNase family protein